LTFRGRGKGDFVIPRKNFYSTKNDKKITFRRRGSRAREKGWYRGGRDLRKLPSTTEKKEGGEVSNRANFAKKEVEKGSCTTVSKARWEKKWPSLRAIKNERTIASPLDGGKGNQHRSFYQRIDVLTSGKEKSGGGLELYQDKEEVPSHIPEGRELIYQKTL